VHLASKCYKSVSVGEFGVTDENGAQRRDKASVRHSKTRAVKIKDPSTNDNLTDSGGAASSDSCGRSVDTRRRCTTTTRVDREDLGNKTTESGTDARASDTADLPRRRQRRSMMTKDLPEEDDVERIQADVTLTGGRLVKSVWKDVDKDVGNSQSSEHSRRRTRNKNVNASTQTWLVDGGNFHELEDHSTHDHRRVEEDGGGYRRHRDVDSAMLADVIRLLAAPILASEMQAAFAESMRRGGKRSAPQVSEERFNRPDDHHHRRRHLHLGHREQNSRQAEDRSGWKPTADVMPCPSVACDSAGSAHSPPATGDSITPTFKCFQCHTDPRRSAGSSNQEADASPMEEARRALVDQLLNEMYRCCDRLSVPGETASRLKTRLKCAILAKYFPHN